MNTAYKGMINKLTNFQAFISDSLVPAIHTSIFSTLLVKSHSLVLVGVFLEAFLNPLQIIWRGEHLINIAFSRHLIDQACLSVSLTAGIEKYCAHFPKPNPRRDLLRWRDYHLVATDPWPLSVTSWAMFVSRKFRPSLWHLLPPPWVTLTVPGGQPLPREGAGQESPTPSLGYTDDVSHWEDV